MGLAGCPSQRGSLHEKIEAIIKPDMFSYVKDALSKVRYPRLTAYDVKCHGRQSGTVETVSGKTIRADILPKTKVEIAVEDKETMDIIIKTACKAQSATEKSSYPL